MSFRIVTLNELILFLQQLSLERHLYTQHNYNLAIIDSVRVSHTDHGKNGNFLSSHGYVIRQAEVKRIVM